MVICCLSDSLSASTLPSCFELLPSYCTFLGTHPQHVCLNNKLHDDFFILLLPLFHVDPVTLKLPNKNDSHVPQATTPMTFHKGTCPWSLLYSLSACSDQNSGFWMTLCGPLGMPYPSF